MNITLFSSSVSGELCRLSDGGLLLDIPDFWLEPLLLFEVPLCAEFGRKVKRLGWTPVDVMQRSKKCVRLSYSIPEFGGFTVLHWQKCDVKGKQMKIVRLTYQLVVIWSWLWSILEVSMSGIRHSKQHHSLFFPNYYNRSKNNVTYASVRYSPWWTLTSLCH